MRDFHQFDSAERLRHIVEYIAFRTIVCVVDMLPVRTSIRLAGYGGSSIMCCRKADAICRRSG